VINSTVQNFSGAAARADLAKVEWVDCPCFQQLCGVEETVHYKSWFCYVQNF